MKEKIIIQKESEVLYQGNILDVPMKEKYLIEKSIDIFGDEDPCVVHLSFVVKEFVTDLLDLFEDNDTININVKDYLEELSFLNFDDLASLTIKLMGKRK